MTSGVECIYLIHHSHADIGYTHDQPIVWDLHRRFLDMALDLCSRDSDRDADDTFRWTIEGTAALEYWLHHARDQQISRLGELARAGRIEVTAMFANLTPLYDTDELVESFQALRTIREVLGLPVTSAMNSDVNGENWPLVDVLLDLGISGFSMAINTHFGGALDPHPLAFRWQGPSGRSILAWNGFSYGLARAMGIGGDAERFATEWWPRLDAWLAEIGYPLPVLLLQIYHPFGDNGSADPSLSTFVRSWNAQGRHPRLRLALPREWWTVVAAHSDRLPILRGDWTDYWNFGCGSTTREVAINRANRARLRAADALRAVLTNRDHQNASIRWAPTGVRAAAHRALHLFDEHTWGADCAIRQPDAEDTITQLHHKVSTAYTARSLSLLLVRDSVAELARRVARDEGDRLLVVNPLPWERIVAGSIPDPDPSMQRGSIDDPTASRHFFDRTVMRRVTLAPTSVPAFGYTVVPATALSVTEPTTSTDSVVENARHRLHFDLERGGLVSWFDWRLRRELVDSTVGLPFHGFIYERVSTQGHPWPRRLLYERPRVDFPPHRGWNPGWPAERLPAHRVVSHRVERTDLGIRVIQHLEAPGVRDLVQEVFLPSYAEHVEFRSSWTMTDTTDPEATYLAFPFAIPEAQAHLDLGGQAIVPERDQLPGACRDYFTVQHWVDLSNDDFGVTIACPDTPMVQLGDFSFGRKQSRFTLHRALFLGWVTNNYWETNFAARQPGRVSACYLVFPHEGGFSETAAHRFGYEAAMPVPVHHLGEPPIAAPLLPRSGSLLVLPSAPILTLRTKPAEDGRGIVLRLLNASDRLVTARIGSEVLKIQAAEQCDLLERPLQPLVLSDGVVTLEIEPRRLACVRLVLEEARL